MNKKTEIVKAYLDLHKEEFSPRPSDETIFNNMIGDVYGECRCENAETGEYEIEISASDSKSGNSVLFDFQYLEKANIHLYTHNYNGSINIYAEIVDSHFSVTDWESDHDAGFGYSSLQSNSVLSLEEAKEMLQLSGEDGGFSPLEKEQVIIALEMSK